VHKKNVERRKNPAHTPVSGGGDGKFPLSQVWENGARYRNVSLFF